MIRILRYATLWLCCLASIPNLAAALETTLNRGVVLALKQPIKLDPAWATNDATTLVRDLFEPLLNIGRDGKPQGALAQRWEISEDGLSYRFFLRPDARWSDNTPVTADDIVFAFERIADQAFSPHRIVYVVKAIRGMDGQAPLGVIAEASDQVLFQLTEPFALNLNFFSHIHSAPLPRHAAPKEKTLWSTWPDPISNGHFMLSKRTSQGVSFSRNPYHREVNAIPWEVVEYTFDEWAPLAKRYLEGHIETIDYIPAKQISWFKGHKPKHYITHSTLKNYYYIYNFKDPILQNKQLRKALRLAVNRPFITSAVLYDSATPAMGLIPNVYGYRSRISPEFSEQSLQQARQLMEEIGYHAQNRLSLSISYNRELEMHESIARIIAQNWSRIFVDLTLKPATGSFTDYLQQLAAGDFQLARMSWVPDYPAAATYFDPILDPHLSGFYHNATFQQAHQKAKRARNPQQQTTLLTKVEQILLEDEAVLPMMWLRTFAIRQPYIDYDPQWNLLGFAMSRSFSIIP